MANPIDNAVRDTTSPERVLAAVSEHPLWYHTMDLGGGVVTPGWFDLRPVIDRLPWPDLRGKRCLDVGTYDGHLAFELERRGAKEVVATDIGDHADWDWPVHMREMGPDRMREIAGERKTQGFQIARSALSSAVEHRLISVYELSPETVGKFDVVVCGALLLHLRDPLRALQAIRSVTTEAFLSAEQIRLGLTVLHPRQPVAAVDGVSDLFQWLVPNAAAHARMVEGAGFAIERATRPYAVPFGVAHGRTGSTGRRAARRVARTLVLRKDGVPYRAVLARPV